MFDLLLVVACVMKPTRRCFGSTHLFWGVIEFHVCFSVSEVNCGGKAQRNEINEKSVALFSVRCRSRLFASGVFGKFCY